MSVNQYRWINIWMAILGHLFIPFPAIFVGRNSSETEEMAIIPDIRVKNAIFILHLPPVVGIKRRARLPRFANNAKGEKKRTTNVRVATSRRVEH